MTLSFWAMAYGLVVGVAGTPADPGRDTTMIAAGGVSLALLLMPAGFAAAALISRRPDWPIAVLAAMGLSLGVGLPLLIFRDPLGALIAGYAAGAVVAVSLPEGTDWHGRAIAAAVVSVLVLVGMAVALVPTAVIAPALPFMAVGIADLLASRRAGPAPAQTDGGFQ